MERRLSVKSGLAVKYDGEAGTTRANLVDGGGREVAEKSISGAAMAREREELVKGLDGLVA